MSCQFGLSAAMRNLFQSVVKIEKNDCGLESFIKLTKKDYKYIFSNHIGFKQVQNTLEQLFSCHSIPIFLYELLNILWTKPSFPANLEKFSPELLTKLLHFYIINYNNEENREKIIHIYEILKTKCHDIIDLDLDAKWSIIPTHFQLTQANVFLKENKGQYQNFEEYINIHYQLIKEEYVGPLRLAINKIIDKGTAEFQDIIIKLKVIGYYFNLL